MKTPEPYLWFLVAIQAGLIIGLLVGLSWLADAVAAVRTVEQKLPRMVYIEKAK